MEQTAVFTITSASTGFSIGSTVNITSKQYNTYNRYGIRKADMFDVMSELADIFNNVIGIGIVFEVD